MNRILSVLPATGRVLFHTKLRSVNRRIYNYTKTKNKITNQLRFSFQT